MATAIAARTTRPTKRLSMAAPVDRPIPIIASKDSTIFAPDTFITRTSIRFRLGISYRQLSDLVQRGLVDVRTVPGTQLRAYNAHQAELGRLTLKKEAQANRSALRLNKASQKTADQKARYIAEFVAAHAKLNSGKGAAYAETYPDGYLPAGAFSKRTGKGELQQLLRASERGDIRAVTALTVRGRGVVLFCAHDVDRVFKESAFARTPSLNRTDRLPIPDSATSRRSVAIDKLDRVPLGTPADVCRQLKSWWRINKKERLVCRGY